MQINRWELLPPRLSCLWRATANTAVVRFTMSAPTATIGAVRLAVPIHAASASSAAMPAWAVTTEQAVTLCAALRIDTFYPDHSFSEVEG